MRFCPHCGFELQPLADAARAGGIDVVMVLVEEPEKNQPVRDYYTREEIDDRNRALVVFLR
jgi:hypothetical protein